MNDHDETLGIGPRTPRVINLSLDQAHVDFLDQLAERTKRSRSDVVRQLVDQLIAKDAERGDR